MNWVNLFRPLAIVELYTLAWEAKQHIIIGDNLRTDTRSSTVTRRNTHPALQQTKRSPQTANLKERHVYPATFQTYFGTSLLLSAKATARTDQRRKEYKRRIASPVAWLPAPPFV
jgi:hypothetical protein